MAKLLKDILKQAHDTIKGVRPSTTAPGSLGKDPGVDYDPKAGDEQDFVAKHSVQKFDDPNGNAVGMYNKDIEYVLNKPTEKRHGNTEAKAKAANEEVQVTESKKAEDVSCNHTPAGKKCPIHEMADCSMSKTIKEEDIDEAYDKSSKAHQAAKKTVKGMGRLARAEYHPDGSASVHTKGNEHVSSTRVVDHHHDTHGLGYNRPEKAYKKSSFKKNGLTHNTKSVDGGHVIHIHEETIDEVLTKSTTAGETIHDFVHSKNPKFAGKSKEKRKQMALAAYYAKQREQKEEVEQVDEISKATLGSYINKSAASLGKAGYKAGSTDGTSDKLDPHIHTINKRSTGIKRATDRLTKEDLAVPLLGGDPPRGDSDEAVEMVKSELKALANKAMHLVMQMPQGMHVEPWCQAKIAQAKSYVSDVHDYMIYGDHEDEKENEQMDTPMTFPNMSVDVNTGQNV